MTEVIIMVFAFGLLAASVFIKNLMIYLGLICSWAAVIYEGDTYFNGWVQLAAVCVIVFALFGIFRLRKGGGDMV